MQKHLSSPSPSAFRPEADRVRQEARLQVLVGELLASVTGGDTIGCVHGEGQKCRTR